MVTRILQISRASVWDALMPSQVIKKTVVPVAGFSSRMLPATKAIPKEMSPKVDKPQFNISLTIALLQALKKLC